MNEIIIPLIIKYSYIVIFPTALIEGPVVALIAGFLVSLGYLKFTTAYMVIVVADVVGDVIYYYIGYYSNRKKLLEKYSSRFPAILRNFSLVENLWKKHEKKTLLLSKLSYGLCIPFLISAGMSKVSLRRFILYVTFIDIFKFGAIVGAGYFLGYSFQKAEGYIVYFGIAVALILITFVVAYIFYSKKYATSEIIQIAETDK